MEDIEEFLSKNFFIIDSNNLEFIDDNFYGYSIYEDKLIINENFENVDLDGIGAYIDIKVQDELIKIQQDIMGSYGIYYYNKEGYFAISNSFLKLVEYLKNFEKLSLNEDYANSFLFSDLCSFVYEDTLVNEISVVPRNCEILINKINKTINFKELNYQFHSIELNSKEGIEILDNWYFRWVNFIRSIKSESNNISIDLTGGFDTRVLSALWLSANIDLNKLNIYTVDDCKTKFQKEDYEISAMIANEFNFKLNNNVMDVNEVKFKSPYIPIALSFYTKLGFHKEMYFRYHKTDKIWFSISGYAGESIRGYPNLTWEQYYENIKSVSGHNNNLLINSTINLLEKGKNKLITQYSIDEEELPEYFYNEVRVRHHYGKSLVEHYFANEIILTPLTDPELLKLKLNDDNLNDNHLLIALIYSRYCPKLLDFKFEGNRMISQDTIDYAKFLNDKYPFQQKNFAFISGPKIKQISVNQLQSKNNDKSGFSINLLKNLVFSKDFEYKFIKYYPIKYYYEIVEKIESEKFHPLRHAYGVIAILKIIDDLNSNSYNLIDWIKSFEFNKKNHVIPPDISSHLLKFNKARIDIKNKGNQNNSIKVIDCDDNFIELNYPEWYNNKDGRGLVIQSTASNLNLKIKCIADGILELYLRGIDFRDKNNNRIPIYINYTSVSHNGKELLQNNILVSHDTPHCIKLNVKDSEILDFSVHWMPINNKVLYVNNEKELLKKNKYLIKKNHELKLDLEAIKNSKSWRITRLFRKIRKIFIRE